MANSLKITHGLILDFALPAAGVSDNFLAVDATGSPTYFASIPVARIAAQTANRAATFNGTGFLAPSATTLTELGYVSGVTSAIQAQLNNKQPIIALTINRAVVSDGIGALTVATTTATEIGYVNGVTSAIQAQLDAKQATITGGASTIVSANLTVNRALMSDGSGKVIVSTVTATELGYSSGVTSAIQSQINAKLTVTVTAPASGDVITYNGAAWVNSASAAQGVPVGGTAGQYLNKINGTNYNTQWSTLVLAKITDVTSTAAEVNLLHGVTASTVQFNYLNTTTSNIQSQLNAKLNNNLSQNAIWVGNASGVPAELSPGTSGYVLTSVGGVPAWQPAPGGGGGITSGGTSTDKAIVRWNGVLGTVVQDSVVVISNAGLITGATWNGNKIGLTYGGTNSDLSATGGAGQYLKQVTGGANITVGTIPASDIASGAALSKVDDTNVTLTLGGGFATALLSASSLTLGWTSTLAYARFVNGAGLSVVGRSTNSSGVQADITAGSDADVLRRTGTSIGFGTIGDASITALAWSKITGTPTTLAGYGITDAATKTWALNPQSASYTFVITDADSKLTQATSASATNFIIPPNASVAFPIGSELPLVWDGTGQPSFVAGAGVTINSSSGDLTVPSRYSVAVAVKAATNTWYLWNGAAFAVQSARTFLAGPLTGAAATPTFRTLASTDIIATDASGVLTNNGAGVLTWAASAGAGTVTSVGWSTSQGVSASIANPTTTPNITITLGALTGVTSLNGLIITSNTGVVTTGTWNATVIAGLYGGTGVANSGKTITLGGNLTTSGAFNTTFAVTGTNTITFPNASITVARQDAAQTLTGVQTFSSNIVLPNQAANTVMAGPTSGGGATPTFRALVAADIPSGVSITNTAAVNELMMSNGTNAVPSGLFADATGNLTLGNGLAGASRFINALGTAADISISSSAKGFGTYTITGNAVTIGGGSFTTIAVGAVSLLGNSSTGSGNAGSDLRIISGPGVTGNANSGNIFIDNAVKVGSGIVGSVSFFKQTADYGGGAKVIYIGNATTSPTTNPTGGGIMFVKSSDNKPYWRTPAGVETVMLGSGGGGGITNTAAANEMMKSDGTNAVPSGIFSTTAGSLTFGDAVDATTNRVITTNGSDPNVDLTFNTKGSGIIYMHGTNYGIQDFGMSFPLGGSITGSGAFGINAIGALIIGNVGFGGSSGPNVELRGNSRSAGTGVVPDLIVQGGASAVTTIAGGNLFLLGGAPSVGNADSGNIYLNIPAPVGTGKYGNISIFDQTGSNYGDGQKILFLASAAVAPTTSISGGAGFYVDPVTQHPMWVIGTQRYDLLEPLTMIMGMKNALNMI